MPTHTAVLALIAPAEPVVAAHRTHLDRAARWGIPAHVTVLSPFVDPGAVDEQVLERLAAAVATVPAFAVTFERTAWFGQDVLWLAPDPAQPFRDLTTAVHAAFPDHPPYAGAFEEAIPHLTIGEHRFGDLAALHDAEAKVGALLPIASRVETVQLFAGAEAPSSWSAIHELALG